MDVFIKYRKLLLFASIYLFFYALYEIYGGIEAISENKNGKGTGIIVDAAIALSASIYIFIMIRRANKNIGAEKPISKS